MFYFEKRLLALTTVLGQGGDEERQAASRREPQIGAAYAR